MKHIAHSISTSLNGVLRGMSALLTAWLALWAMPSTAQTFSTTGTANIGTNATCGTAVTNTPVVVNQSIVIADLDVGFVATHTWRGDIRLVLVHPNGTTTAEIISDEINNTNFNNYNILLDQASGTPVNTGGHANNDTVGPVPPYEHTVQPSNSLNVFNGLNAQGTWNFRICDNFAGGDVGTFDFGQLVFATTAVESDLSLSVSSPTSAITTGQTTPFTFTVTNAGPTAATGIQVTALPSAGLGYVSSAGNGTYDFNTGLWTIPGSLASGASVTRTVTVGARTGGSTTYTAEITASGNADPDSTPNNRGTAPGEDDTASKTLTLTVPPAETPPTLTCSIPLKTFDWGSSGWTTGSLTGGGTISGVPVNLTFSGDTGFFVNNAAFGGQTPLLTTLFQGGTGVAQNSILPVVNFDNNSRAVTMTLTMGATGTGVNKAQFTIFDLDENFNASANTQFIDRVTITGFLGAASVTPTLYYGTANRHAGNVATGIADSETPNGDGNLIVTFPSRVDRVVMTYDNDPAVNANPGQQGIGIHSINMCGPVPDAVLNASKINAMYVPGEFALPGNDVLYTITVGNSGGGDTDTDSIVLIDEMPSEISFYNGDIDDGGPETNPVSFAQTNGTSLTWTYADDVGYWNGPTKPTTFAGCSYSPSAGYDATVSYICFNPKGFLSSNDPDHEFTVQFRARIN